MEQLTLESKQQELHKLVNDHAGDYEMQTALYRQLTEVLEQLQSIYKQQLENLKRQIR